MIYKTQREAIKTCRQSLATFNFNNFFLSLGDVTTSYNFRDPKEKARLEFYSDLLEKYQYPVGRIEFDAAVFLECSGRLADIVVFKDDERKIPYIAVECRKDGISGDEFQVDVKEAILKAEALGADFAVCVSGAKRRIVKLTRVNGVISQKIIRDLPVSYGEGE